MGNILVAEDEPDIRNLIKFTLEFAGHEVIVATNGEEALKLARVDPPELVLMDVRMPKMNGYEACQAMKADPKLQNVPVVFLSAKGQEVEVQTGLDVGAADYIVKPFSPDELTQRVTEILTAA